jgi:hypothetical protein
MLEKIEAKLVPPERKWLRIIIHEGDAEAVVKEKQEKALAEHVASHPEDAGRTVEDFFWIVQTILRPPFHAPGSLAVCAQCGAGNNEDNKGLLFRLHEVPLHSGCEGLWLKVHGIEPNESELDDSEP